MLQCLDFEYMGKIGPKYWGLWRVLLFAVYIRPWIYLSKSKGKIRMTPALMQYNANSLGCTHFLQATCMPWFCWLVLHNECDGWFFYNKYIIFHYVYLHCVSESSFSSMSVATWGIFVMRISNDTPANDDKQIAIWSFVWSYARGSLI